MLNAKVKILPFQIIQISDGVILKRSATEISVKGPGAVEALQAVLALADSGATVENICAAFSTVARPTVEQLLNKLIEKRLLVIAEGDTHLEENTETALDVFYWNFGSTGLQVANVLNAKKIAILGVNYVSRQLVNVLNATGVQNFTIVDVPILRNLRLFNEEGRLENGWQSNASGPVDYLEWSSKTEPAHVNCIIATSDFGGHKVLRDWNRMCVENKVHYLPVSLCDGIGWLGPLVLPGDTPCFECFWMRLQSTTDDRQIRQAIDDVRFAGQPFTGFHPSMASILGDIAAMELTKFYGGVLPMTNLGTAFEVNLIATSIKKHRVLKAPRCAVCSSLNSQSTISLKKSVFNDFVSNPT